MSDAESIQTGEAEAHRDDHEAGDGHDDDHGTGHGHDEAPLGPIDVVAWGAGVLGLLIGAVTALAFALSTGRLFA